MHKNSGSSIRLLIEYPNKSLYSYWFAGLKMFEELSKLKANKWEHV